MTCEDTLNVNHIKELRAFIINSVVASLPKHTASEICIVGTTKV